MDKNNRFPRSSWLSWLDDFLRVPSSELMPLDTADLVRYAEMDSLPLFEDHFNRLANPYRQPNVKHCARIGDQDVLIHAYSWNGWPIIARENAQVLLLEIQAPLGPPNDIPVSATRVAGAMFRSPRQLFFFNPEQPGETAKFSTSATDPDGLQFGTVNGGVYDGRLFILVRRFNGQSEQRYPPLSGWLVGPVAFAWEKWHK